MAFELPALSYAFDALEPHIDAATMEIHHDRHHQAYVDNANAALAGTDWENASVEEVVTHLQDIPEDIRMAVRNNAGGHYNHSLFWEIMGPGGGGTPTGALGEAIDAAFGSFDELKAKVNDAGVKRFGSGWSWLVVDGGGRTWEERDAVMVLGQYGERGWVRWMVLEGRGRERAGLGAEARLALRSRQR